MSTNTNSKPNKILKHHNSKPQIKINKSKSNTQIKSKHHKLNPKHKYSIDTIEPNDVPSELPELKYNKSLLIKNESNHEILIEKAELPNDSDKFYSQSNTIDQSISNHLSNLINSQERISSYTSLQRSLLPIRGNIIDWLLDVTDRMKVAQETFFKAIILFDKYISKLTHEITNPPQIHFIAVICFFIAYKFEETSVMILDFVITKLLHSKYSKKEIVTQETQILITLNFRLNFPSLNTFAKIIIEKIKISNLHINQSQQPSKQNNQNEQCFILKLDCIFNFVNKISLFVDEFIFEINCFNITLINFRTSLMLLSDVQINKIISLEDYQELERFFISISKDYLTETELKQVEVMAQGLYLAIINRSSSW